jgi:hypothetical protein
MSLTYVRILVTVPVLGFAREGELTGSEKQPIPLKIIYKKHIILMILSLHHENRYDYCGGYGREPADMQKILRCMSYR